MGLLYRPRFMGEQGQKCFQEGLQLSQDGDCRKVSKAPRCRWRFGHLAVTPFDLPSPPPMPLATGKKQHTNCNGCVDFNPKISGNLKTVKSKNIGLENRKGQEKLQGLRGPGPTAIHLDNEWGEEGRVLMVGLTWMDGDFSYPFGSKILWRLFCLGRVMW